MSASAVSHQLRLLREMRLVRSRREGKHVFYTLDDEHIYELFQRGVEHASHN
jgi:DNA-binding transcriptional ArsR family regulator